MRLLKPIPLLALVFTAASVSAQADVNSLKPGLVVTHRDGTGIEIVRLEPTVALNLKPGESAHPRLGDGGKSNWHGYLNVTRADHYRFRVRLRGTFKLTVGNKEVLAAEVKDDAPALKEGTEVRLEVGMLPLSAEFTRLAGTARVELLWESKHFPEEPLPFDVLGHLPDKSPARLKSSRLAEEGRWLAEEHACTRCHQSGDNKVAKTLQPRQGPDLSKAGERIHGEWIYRWLESPRKMRQASVMPELFSADETGAAERYAVMRYLISLGGPIADKEAMLQPKQLEDSSKRGQQLFMSTGCVICHGTPGTPAPKLKKGDEEERPRTFLLHSPPRLYPFKGMGGKTNPNQLAAFLRNPHAINPASRMPNMLLDPREALDLAHYLCEASGPKDHKLPAVPAGQRGKIVERYVRDDKGRQQLEKLPDEAMWAELGKRIAEAKGCVSCHTIAPAGKALPAFTAAPKLDELKDQTNGCLAEEETKRGKSPRFTLDRAEREAVRAFLNEGLKGVGANAPAYHAAGALRRFNCLGCHGRDGEGGLEPALIEQLRKYEKADNLEAVMPPPLTGVGHKLRTPWMREVLTKAGRARPWMGLRMPQFGESNVGQLPEALALLDGTDPAGEGHKVTLSGEKVAAGRFLVGKQAFGCIGCHDIAGIPNHGTRGPDLASMNERVRYGWYQRWLVNAQRLQPGTRMPTVFQDGKTQLASVLKGSADAQAEAMWAYLSLGPTLPLPEGLETAVKGLMLTVKDRPLVFRTFMPDAGTRAIAVGHPEGISTAFDATTCRLAYAWTGQFLDVSPVWDGRGGNPAKLLGPKFWTAPEGCPWGVTSGSEPPDFVKRRSDPAFGAKLPEGKLLDGPPGLHFDGYRTYLKDVPTFRYRVGQKAEEMLQVEERAEPLRSHAGVGVHRAMQITTPAKGVGWLLAAESEVSPRLLDDRGQDVKHAWKENGTELPMERVLVAGQAGSKPVLLRVTSAPKNSVWYVQRVGKVWQVMLRLPRFEEPMALRAGVALWVPHRDDPGLLKELMPAR